jgi:methylphosphotriester-DNA--protein-cysteine methyltransferase
MFYRTAAEARADNLRPCLRCHPLVTDGTDRIESRIHTLCDYIPDFVRTAGFTNALILGWE